MRTLGSAPILGIILAGWLSSALAGPLHDAAKNGDLEQLKQLLDQGTDRAAHFSVQRTRHPGAVDQSLWRQGRLLRGGPRVTG